MPKKPNSHGNDQEYVPKGNGDASGEYADDGGSNKHFTSFSKPDDYSKPVEASGSSEVAEEPKGEVEEKGEVGEKKAEEKPANEFEKIDELAKETRIGELDEGRKSAILNSIANAIDRQNYDWNKGRDILGENFAYLQQQGVLQDWTREDYDKVANLLSQKLDGKYFVQDGERFYGTGNAIVKHLVGQELLTQEEADARKSQIRAAKVEEATKKRDKLLTPSDSEIKKSFGEKTVVAFGKGYSKERLTEIAGATQRMVSDFEGLKDFCTQIGDKSTLNTYNEYQGIIDDRRKGKYSLGNSTIAAYCYDGSGTVRAIVYNGAVAKKETNESAKYSYDTNFHSSDKEIGTLYHEMGHMVDDFIGKTTHDYFSPQYKAHQEIINGLRKQVNELFVENDALDIKEKYKEKFGKTYNARNYYDQAQMDLLVRSYRAEGQKAYKISEYGNTNVKEFVAECFSAHYTDMNNELATKVVNLYKDAYKKIKEIG